MLELTDAAFVSRFLCLLNRTDVEVQCSRGNDELQRIILERTELRRSRLSLAVTTRLSVS
jgi:hypothetical protein